MKPTNSSSQIEKVLVVGGGAAGWLSACLIAAISQRNGRRLEVALVESENIPLLGVGEGTWPSMRQTLQSIGIDESEFLTECDASFKQGSQFVDWAMPNHSYYHPFSLPKAYSSVSLAPYCQPNLPFANQVSAQPDVCDLLLAPKQAQMPNYAYALNYGYHLDAVKFAALLARHGKEKLHVSHQFGDVSQVQVEHGRIESVVLSNGQALTADLYIDCTGMKSMLLGEALETPYVSVKQYLPNDRAIAVQLPYQNDDDDIASVTRATAQTVGWVWDIGLQSRRGVGQVYASEYISDDGALEQLRCYVKKTAPHVDFETLPKKHLAFNPGYRREFWRENCVAIGMSAGFIEPLEASALALIEQSARFVAEKLPQTRENLPIVAKRFNRKFHYHWQGIIDFLALHYVLSRRDDSTYWTRMSDEQTTTQTLQEGMALWRELLPEHDERPMIDELFPVASYHYVLLGMGFSSTQAHKTQTRITTNAFDEVAKMKQQCCSMLPRNRQLLNQLRASALSKAPA